MAKLTLLASLLRSLVSNNYSAIILICWFGAQETFLIFIIFEEYSCAAFDTFYYALLFDLLFYSFICLCSFILLYIMLISMSFYYKISCFVYVYIYIYTKTHTVIHDY